MFEKGMPTGNGNGSKMNMRLEILNSILARETEITVEGGSARVNSLKQVIRKHRTDMADTPSKSLDLMRKIYQNEITREINQILERYMNGNFAPAIENLKRNGHTVDEDVINEVLVNILEAAKKPYMKNVPDRSHYSELPQRENHKRGYESDESDISIISHSSESKRRRGRPRKEEEYTLLEMAPVTEEEVMKWNPERFHFATRFVPAIKIAAMLSLPVTILFNKYPRMFRYSCDEEDKNVLADENKVQRQAGRCYLMTYDDAKLILGAVSEVLLTPFTVNDHMILKIRQKAQQQFEKLKGKMTTSQTFSFVNQSS